MPIYYLVIYIFNFSLYSIAIALFWIIGAAVKIRFFAGNKEKKKQTQTTTTYRNKQNKQTNKQPQHTETQTNKTKQTNKHKHKHKHKHKQISTHKQTKQTNKQTQTTTTYRNTLEYSFDFLFRLGKCSSLFGFLFCLFFEYKKSSCCYWICCCIDWFVDLFGLGGRNLWKR